VGVHAKRATTTPKIKIVPGCFSFTLTKLADPQLSSLCCLAQGDSVLTQLTASCVNYCLSTL